VHEQNVVGHLHHLRRAIQTKRPPAGFPSIAASAVQRRFPAHPPQTVHVAFISLRPLFFTRGNMEEESHGEEKEEELEIENLKQFPV
jgi:hypothetical protein